MSGRGYTAWCHFNFDAEAAPTWLKRQSEDARLTKDNVSLSFLHFSAKGRKLEAEHGKSLVRAVSGPFELPASGKGGESQYRRYGQYACSDRGLTLLSLPHRHLVPQPGTLLEATWPETPDKDAKSGALVLPLNQLPGKEALAPVASAPAPIIADTSKRKPPRLPSERPLVRAPKPKPKARPVTETASRPEPKTPGKPEATPGATPEAKSGAKPARLPSERPQERGPKDARLPSERPLKRGPKPRPKSENTPRADSKAPGTSAGQAPAQPADKRPTDKQSADKRPADKRFTDTRPAGEWPPEKRSTGKKSSGQKATGPKPKKKKATSKKARAKKSAAKKKAS